MWNPFKRHAYEPGVPEPAEPVEARPDALPALPVAEARTIDSVPWSAGVLSPTVVSEDKATHLTPVYAANRHISDTISTLPLHGYTKLGGQRRKLTELPLLFRQLDDIGELVDWVCEAVTSLGFRGNAVGLVTSRDDLGYPTAIEWLSMSGIYVDDSNPRPVWYYGGRKLNGDGRNPTVDEFVHIPLMKVPGKTLGLSPIEYAMHTIGLGTAAAEYGADWFNAGGIPPGTMKNSEQIVDAGAADTIRARLVAAIRSHQPLVYGRDWEYSAIQIPPEQAQFVETHKLTANQIAAIYGIAPDEIGGEAANSLTYSTEELRQIRRLADLNSWIVRLERKFKAWLEPPQYIKFNVDAPIRTDIKTRHEIHAADIKVGLRQIAEIREIEDWGPLPQSPTADRDLLIEILKGAPTLAPTILPMLGYSLPTPPPPPAAAAPDPNGSKAEPPARSVSSNGHKAPSGANT